MRFQHMCRNEPGLAEHSSFDRSLCSCNLIRISSFELTDIHRLRPANAENRADSGVLMMTSFLKTKKRSRYGTDVGFQQGDRAVNLQAGTVVHNLKAVGAHLLDY